MGQPLKIFTLILAAFLVFSGILWFSSGRDFPIIDGGEAGGNSRVTPEGSDEEDIPEVTIMLTGNLLCNYSYQKKLYDESTEEFSFSDTFEYVAPIFDEADLVVGNLDCCAAESLPVSLFNDVVDDKGYANAPVSYLDALKNAGVNALTMSDEHNCDTGREGIIETLDAVDERGFLHAGLYRNVTEPHYFMYEAAGMKIAFLSFSSEFRDDIAELNFAEKNAILSMLDTSRVIADISAARENGADYVIVYFNRGDRYEESVSSDEKGIMQMLADAGADMMVDVGPYVLKSTGEVIRNGVKIRCIYGLGTFTGKYQREETRETAIYKIVLRRDENGQVKAASRDFIPCFMAKNWRGRHYVLIPEGTECSSETEKILEGHYENIRKTLGVS